MSDFNIVVAHFGHHNRVVMTDTLYQYNYGQKLKVEGITALPQTFQAHFSNVQRGGVSITVTGINGMVDVPNSLLMTGKRIYCWIYVTETGSGETVYQILMPVQSRPMPEYYDVEDVGVFDSVVNQVAEYAATATTGATSATASATAAAGSETAAASSASAAADSAENAAASEANAEASASAAQASDASAATAASTATTKAAEAAQSATSAGTAADRAEAAQEAAETAQEAAETAATSATADAATATAKATAAAASATTADHRATDATNAATTATAQAVAAESAKTTAVEAKTAAQSAQSAAETAATTATAKATEAAASATAAAQAAASINTPDSALSNTSTNAVQNKVITESVTQVKSAIAKYNACDALSNYKKSSYTSYGITYTWNGDICTVNGTSTNHSANVICNTTLPDGIVPGGKYAVRYSTTDTNAMLRIMFKKADDTLFGALYFLAGREIEVPAEAVGWNVALYVAPNREVDAIVSGVAILSAKTNKELYENGLMTKGVLPDNTDLDTLSESGMWTINSTYTYINNPTRSGVGATLLCFKSSPTVMLQIVEEVSQYEPKMYTRSYVAATGWTDWVVVNGGDTYNNAYVTQNYENTYNITATPTITTDTNNYLASTNDNTDRTGDIQTMLNTTGVCHLGPGKFVVTGVEIPNFGLLTGSGTKSMLVLADSVTTGYAVKLRTYSRVTNVRIVGSQTDITRPSEVGTRHGVLFEGTANAASGATTFYRSAVDHCVIGYFTGGGITMYNTGLSPTSSLHVSDVFVFRCGVGVNIPYFSEFHRITNVSAQDCLYGCVDNGGNNNFANCDFSGNTIALLIDNSTGQSRNNTHGTFSCCSFHHSDNTYSGGSIVSVGTAIRILGASNGEIFTGCQIGYGNLEIDDSKGIRFDACNFLRMTALQITDSPLVVFSDCNFWDAASSPLTQSGNTTLKFSDCYLMDGTAFNPMAA